jgi:hypothetical protein
MIVTTIYGEMDESLLQKRTRVKDNENEHTIETEYWLGGVLVHKSAHVHLKKNLFADSKVSGF